MRNLIDAINDLRKLDNELKSGRVWTPADSKRISRAIRAMEAAAKRLVWAPVGREFGSPDWLAAEKAGKLEEFMVGEWSPKRNRK